MESSNGVAILHQRVATSPQHSCHRESSNLCCNITPMSCNITSLFNYSKISNICCNITPMSGNVTSLFNHSKSSNICCNIAPLSSNVTSTIPSHKIIRQNTSFNLLINFNPLTVGSFRAIAPSTHLVAKCFLIH